MQVAAWSRMLRRCSCQSFTAFSGINTSSRAVHRLYHDIAVERDANEDHVPTAGAARIPSKAIYSARDHPLSIEALQNLNPDVKHIFVSRSKSPYFNLAVEHHLLTYSNPSSRILFIYTNSPCVVIGRNQNPWVECDLAAIGAERFDKVKLVRRRSGGGAVFHDLGNLNYTVIVPGEGFERRKHVQMVVDALTEYFQEGMVEAKRWEEVKVNERNDIVAKLQKQFRNENEATEWFKVSGTAFKLTRGRALHHGTLLHSSPFVESIGSLLRSLGKEYITAKGVESVRSPVTNLYRSDAGRHIGKAAGKISAAIWTAWRRLDSPEALTVNTKPIRIGHDNAEELVPELKIGIDELQSPTWKWDQTPGFSFSSTKANTTKDITFLEFEVKNGVIQTVKTLQELQVLYEKKLVGKKITSLSVPGSWRVALENEVVSGESQNALIELVEKCFPSLAFSGKNTGEGHPKALDAKLKTITSKKPKRSKNQNGAVKVTKEENSGGGNIIAATRPITVKAASRETRIPHLSTRLFKQFVSRINIWTRESHRLGNSKSIARSPAKPGAVSLTENLNFIETVRSLIYTTIRLNTGISEISDRIALSTPLPKYDMLRRLDGANGQVENLARHIANLDPQVKQISSSISHRGADLPLRFVTMRRLRVTDGLAEASASA